MYNEYIYVHVFVMFMLLLDFLVYFLLLAIIFLRICVHLNSIDGEFCVLMFATYYYTWALFEWGFFFLRAPYATHSQFSILCVAWLTKEENELHKLCDIGCKIFKKINKIYIRTLYTVRIEFKYQRLNVPIFGTLWFCWFFSSYIIHAEQFLVELFFINTICKCIAFLHNFSIMMIMIFNHFIIFS